jgi:hypothetical protein
LENKINTKRENDEEKKCENVKKDNGVTHVDFWKVKTINTMRRMGGKEKGNYEGDSEKRL